VNLHVEVEGERVCGFTLNLPPIPNAYLVTETGDPVAEFTDEGTWEPIVKEERMVDDGETKA
jgi:hypothetical protein